MKPIVQALLLAFTTAAFALHAAPLLRNPQPVAPGTDYIYDVLHADFNGDGHEDLLVVNPGKALSVHLDNGTGPFAAPVITPISYNTTGTTAGDVNGDGRVDVILVDYPTHSVVVMLGNGDGTFVQGSSFTAANLVGPIAAGDFNGDHLLDLAVAFYDGMTGARGVAVYFGDGGGNFSGGMHTSVTMSTIWKLTAADMNGDGKSDVLAVDGSATSILISSGDGTLVQKGWTRGYKVATGDFNHDGNLDLAISDGSTHAWLIEVDLGNGDGSVTQSAQYVSGYQSQSIAAADINGDGNLDLLASALDGEVTVMLGKGDGTFHPANFFFTGPNATNITISDFDRDGKADFVAATSGSYPSFLSFVRGNGDGTFQTYRGFHTGSVVPVQWPGLVSGGNILADMNNDGKPDVIVTQRHPNDPNSLFDLGVLLNDGTGMLAPPILTNTGKSGAYQFAIGDVNRDGKLDAVVFASSFGVSTGETLFGNGDGTFMAPIMFANPAGMTLADFDGDAFPDLLGSGGLQHGNGDGIFGTAVPIGNGIGEVLTADLNGDGKLDFITWSQTYTFAFINDGSGHFTQAATVAQDSSTPQALGDFNGDLKIDLVSMTNTAIAVRPGNGDGTFGAPMTMKVQALLQGGAAVADFDGDGKLDIAFGTSVLLGKGDGTFQSLTTLRQQDGLHTHTADMDGNGSPDLVCLTTADDVGVVLTRTANDPTAQSSITLSADKTTAHYGEQVTFTAQVSGGLVPLTGVVRFDVNDRPVALIAVDGTGRATFTSGFPTGSLNITATYTGDEYYLTSTDSLPLNVGKATSTIYLSSDANPESGGIPVSLYAYLASSSSLSTATGVITIREGTTTRATIPAAGGWASLGTPSVGSHLLIADYPGDPNFEASSASYTQVITKPVPRLSIVVDPSTNVVQGTPVNLHAWFTNTTQPTGTIQFVDRASTAVVGTVPIVNGVADLQTSFSWGQHYIQANYFGDSTWASTSSPIWSFTVYAGSFGTPLAIRASGSTASASLVWTPIIGAAKYTVWYRKTLIDGWQMLADYPNQTNAIVTMTSNATWEFAVTATDANANVSAMSPPDLATTVVFTDPTIVPGVTPAKPQHITQLRTAVASVRTFAGLSAFAYTTTPTAGQPILTTDILELRTALSQARNAIGLPVTFSDSTLTPGLTPIRAAHIIELRAGVD